METIDTDLKVYLDEVEKADIAIGAMSDLDAVGAGHGRPLGAVLIKMIDESPYTAARPTC
ncbi:MAG: hypothetical protein WD652_02975 [Acidimicrobiia bacterium]